MRVPALFVLSAWLLIALSAHAQTFVEGRIEADTTWQASGNPYVLTGDVEVGGGATLTIEEGTWIQGGVGARLVIGGETTDDLGTLLVLGGPRPVRFTEREFRDRWGGIVFRPGAVPAEFDEAGLYRTGSLIRGAEIDDAMRPITMDQVYAYLEDVEILIGLDNTRAAILIDLPRVSAVEMRAARVTVKNGLGGGMRINYGGPKVLTDCVFEENYGVGLLVWSLSSIARDSTHVVSRCTFRNNENRSGRESDGGGAWLVGYGEWQVVDCVFENNTSSRNGGGLMAQATDSVTLAGCTFEGNRAPNSGGGVDLNAEVVLVEHCHFMANTAGTSAGGMLSVTRSAFPSTGIRATVRECVFKNNRAGRGGALTLDGDVELLERNRFISNASTTGGGAIRFINNALETRLVDNVFESNATAGVGGAVSFITSYDRRNVEFVGNVFDGNSARLGGAVHTSHIDDDRSQFDLSPVNGLFNTFTNNTAQLGDAIYHAGPVDIDATGVCWGTSVPAAIANRIYDGRDGPGLGIVSFDPVAPDCEDCRVDLDGDGALTLFDYLAFSGLFGLGDLQADFDGDGALTIFDFLLFQTEFQAGCP
jgi:hypothetical protein